MFRVCSDDRMKLNWYCLNQLSKQNQTCMHGSDHLQENLMNCSSYELCNRIKDLCSLSLPPFCSLFRFPFFNVRKHSDDLSYVLFIYLSNSIVYLFVFPGVLNQRRKKRNGSQKAKLPRDLGCRRKMRENLKNLLLHVQEWLGKKSRR